MGYEAECTLRMHGTASKGIARLEQKDLVFRGDVKLAIPLADVKSATARDGVLRVRFRNREAALEIGAPAAKWASRITNPPSRLDKLGVKPGMLVAAPGLSDPSFLEELERRGARIVATPGSRKAAVDLLFHRAEERKSLEQLSRLKERIRPDGAIWIVRPKGSKAITEAETMVAGKRAGLVDVKVVSFSDTHTAEKFVIPVADRPKPASRRAAVGHNRGGG
jgi:hypothetical protein